MELWIIFPVSLLTLLVNVIGFINVEAPSYWDTPFAQPYFDNTTKRDLTATVGQVALLRCRVRNLGDRAVSWIRKRDLHILTIGIMTYTNDQRFQSLHTEGSDEWTLKISSPQLRDSGIYECQVSTEPKISMAFRLTVVVSKAKILGNPELFIKSGSDINLTCVAIQAPAPPSFIYWYKDGRLINYSQRGGINVLTERQTRTSKLVIARATPADSGNYTCSPSNSGQCRGARDQERAPRRHAARDQRLHLSQVVRTHPRRHALERRQVMSVRRHLSVIVPLPPLAPIKELIDVNDRHLRNVRQCEEAEKIPRIFASKTARGVSGNHPQLQTNEIYLS